LDKSGNRHKPSADNVAHFSSNLQRYEKLLLEIFETPEEIVIAPIEWAREGESVSAFRMKINKIARVMNLLCKNMSPKCWMIWLSMKCQYARGNHIFEHSDVSQDKQKLAAECMRNVLDWRGQKTKRVILRWPSESLAQQAKVGVEKFENFSFDACPVDYSRLQAGMDRRRNAA
jgi:aminopeptidase